MATNTLVWDEIMVDAFQYLFTTLSSSHVLWLPREGDHLVVHIDTSYEGIVAVLSAKRDGIQRPLGFYSKKLLPVVRNYAATARAILRDVLLCDAMLNLCYSEDNLKLVPKI